MKVFSGYILWGVKFETRKLDEAYIVNVLKKECNCRLWQLNGYRCIHYVATLACLNITPDGSYVYLMYLGALFHNTYKQPIHGMNGSNMWPSTEYIPPMKRRMLGRPTIKRIRDASKRHGKHNVSKVGKKITCGICKQEGHNKSTCSQVERIPKVTVTKKQKVRQTQKPVNLQKGREDVVMVDVGDQQIVHVNATEQVVRVNETVGKVDTTGQPKQRKNQRES